MQRISPQSLTRGTRHGLSSSPLAPRPSRLVPRAFTLVELLVVITIIGILASLLVVAGMAAMNTARRTRIKAEIDQIHQGFEQYKNEVSGGDYPPNATVSGSMATLAIPQPNATQLTQMRGQVQNDMTRHLKKVSSRITGVDQTLAQALAGVGVTGWTIYSGPSSGTGIMLEGGMSPAEALVFWLNGFSSDPKAPLTGSGGPVYIKQNFGINGGAEGRTPVFPFEITRLGPRDDSGNFIGRYIEFPVPNNNSQTYRLNLWQYYPAGSNEPLVYFDTSRPLMDVEPVASYPGPHVHAIKQPSSSATAGNEVRYANEGKFQILHCGLDGKWGNFDPMSLIGKTTGSLQAQMLLFPKGPFTLDLADTLTNFTTGALEDAQP